MVVSFLVYVLRHSLVIFPEVLFLKLLCEVDVFIFFCYQFYTKLFLLVFENMRIRGNQIHLLIYKVELRYEPLHV